MFQFGSGNLTVTRTDVANATPTRFGTLQDIEVDFDFTNKELYGQYQFAADVARAQGKITGKAKSATITARSFNDAFFGQTLTTAGGVLVASNETATIGGTPYQVTPANASTFQSDQGVYYSATGVPFVRVASSPATGQYSVNATTGVYTFAAADTGAAVLVSYTYTVNTGANRIQGSNLLMGSSPVFSVLLNNTYKSKVFNLTLFAAISTKLTFPFKNQDYVMNDFEFTAYANAAGQVFDITSTD